MASKKGLIIGTKIIPRKNTHSQPAEIEKHCTNDVHHSMNLQQSQRQVINLANDALHHHPRNLYHDQTLLQHIGLALVVNLLHWYVYPVSFLSELNYRLGTDSDRVRTRGEVPLRFEVEVGERDYVIDVDADASHDDEEGVFETDLWLGRI